MTLFKSILVAVTFFSTVKTMAKNLETSQNFFNQLSLEQIDLVDRFYAENITFQDPIHTLNGVKQLKQYYANLYRNVDSIRFEYGQGIESAGTVSLPWKMHLKTAALNSGKEFAVDGISLILFNEEGKATYHRDYFDMGEFVYERISILRNLIHYIKNRMAGD